VVLLRVLLATGTFTGETASGWQTLTFSSPVAISANTSYIASYHAPVGYYASSSAYFTSAVTTYPLSALASVSGSGNGCTSTSRAPRFRRAAPTTPPTTGWT